MVRLGAFAICFVLAIALNSAICSTKAFDSNVNVAVVHNLTTFLSENPDVKILHPLIREQLSDGASPKIQINYRLGNRISGECIKFVVAEVKVRKINILIFWISGDRLVATANGGNQWPSPQDVKLTLTYPRSGVGNVVTFIQILVEQVSILIVEHSFDNSSLLKQTK